eukprot:TRINITY_DN12721_c0_g1_i1.p1 TRINITY_DN12721_c0_g1~~TRINITY_DN12721_c0_g1_i1.p1  ORF type:complete len:121 (-),score=21.78 TRINITY_DN12721_c0_g1_i1:62-424(-)
MAVAGSSSFSSFSSTIAMPTSEIMAEWSTIKALREYYRVPDAVWEKFAEALGSADLDDVLLLAGVGDEDYASTRGCCGVGPLQKSSLPLLFQRNPTQIRYVNIVNQISTTASSGKDDGHQ